MRAKPMLATAVAICSLAVSGTCAAQLTWGPTGLALGENTEHMETPYYRVGPFNWFGAVLGEAYSEWCYPTPEDCREPGWFGISPEQSARADFNQDGREDLLIVWNIFPHTIPRDARAPYTILLNDGSGGLQYAPGIFEDGGPVRFFPYRTAVADFNGDGRPDITSAPGAMIQRHPDGSVTVALEPFPLALSTPEGKLRDASANIEGQESGGVPPCFDTGHDMSVGDVDGDGSIDIYSSSCLFLNDGNGVFSNATAQLPPAMRPATAFVMTSLVGDLDQDGIGDLVAAYTDGGPPGYVMLSAGAASISERTTVPLPVGRFGANITKFNHGAILDVNLDGLQDVVFSVTRADPYYVGRGLQVLINHGGGQLVDETSTRVFEHAGLDTRQGEGTLYVADLNVDGTPDLVHAGDDGSIYINSNGKLYVQDEEHMAWVQPWQIAGFEPLREWHTRGAQTRLPVQLDGLGGMDFVSILTKIPRDWPQDEPSYYSLYSILAVDPLPLPEVFASGFEVD